MKRKIPMANKVTVTRTEANNLNKRIHFLVGPVPMVRRLVETVEDADTEVCAAGDIGRLLLHAERGQTFVTGAQGRRVVVKVLRVE